MRTVHCEDAILWLKQYEVLEQSCMVASLPDISEFNLSLDQWKEWFKETAKLIMQKTPAEGASVFFQTDIKIDGRWIDKAFLIQQAAAELEQHQLFHKIVCRVIPGVSTKGKPAYSHLLSFSQSLSLDLNRSTPDVIPGTGDKTWERGMGLSVSQTVARFLKEQCHCKTVVNPFCGEGSMLAAANEIGLEAIGIERSPKRAQKARELKIEKGQFLSV